MWHKTKLPEYTTSIQQEAWRQRLNKETGQTKDATMRRIEELEAELKQRNTYYNNFRKPEAAAATEAQITMAEANPRGFDMVFAMDDEPEAKPVD